MSSVLSFTLMIFMAFLGSCSQLLLKKAAGIQRRSVIFEYLNARVICAYGLLFLTLVGNSFFLKFVPVSYGAVAESSGYIFVAVLGRLFFKERITVKKIIGILLIISGVCVFGLI